jgi:hypothetical protein
MTLHDLPLFSQPARFDGPDLTPEDTPRLATQLEAVRDFMTDGRFHTLTEIAAAAKCTTQSASARIRDLRKSRFGGHKVERRRIADTAVYQYRLAVPEVKR